MLSGPVNPLLADEIRTGSLPNYNVNVVMLLYRRTTRVQRVLCA